MNNPFDYVTAVSFSKEDMIVDAASEKAYPAFLVNRSLSNFTDTVFDANEMNMMHHLDNKMQFSYLINNLKPRKRFAKWTKKTKDDDLEAIMKCGYSINRAKEILLLLSQETIKTIKEKQKGE